MIALELRPPTTHEHNLINCGYKIKTFKNEGSKSEGGEEHLGRNEKRITGRQNVAKQNTDSIAAE